jgi:hypothetical protein
MRRGRRPGIWLVTTTSCSEVSSKVGPTSTILASSILPPVLATKHARSEFGVASDDDTIDEQLQGVCSCLSSP